MKTLSLRQPWAGMIATGEKNIETRTWRTLYRGDLLICSSLKFDKNATVDWFTDPQYFLRGMTICVVDLVDCVPMEGKHVDRACCDVYYGAWAWILENIRVVRNIPIKGSQGIFNSKFEPKDLWL